MNPSITLAFEPLVPWPAITILGAAAVAVLIAYAVRGGRAPVSRTLGLLVGLIALLGPQTVRETRAPAPDVGVIVVDRSDSMDLAGRRAAADAAAKALSARFGDGTTVRVVEAPGDRTGVDLFGALERAVADTPPDRIAGAILLTDGRAHDAPSGRYPFPVHALVIGREGERDLVVRVRASPRIAIVGETAQVAFEVTGGDPGETASLEVSIDGAPMAPMTVRIGEAATVAVPIQRRGPIQVLARVRRERDEITSVNNAALATISGVRDRLRVLLITGEPHAGARTWRNLLKSDPSVELIHFTILRPPDKQDETPLDELALIAFPVNELFEETLDDFDLVVLDRARQLTILPRFYFSNLARYVERGGALLAVLGPEEADGSGLLSTPLAGILPAQGPASVRELPFRPAVTAAGAGHPVTAGLAAPESWGRWLRAIVVRPAGGVAVLDGPGGAPLLTLQRVGEGRVAVLASDQSWLWARGFEGGGPFADIFRRTAHWLMKEPELDDERFSVRAEAGRLIIERRTTSAAPGQAQVEGPDGARSETLLSPAAPGLWRGDADATLPGLYTAQQAGQTSATIAAPRHPIEFRDATAGRESLQTMLRPMGGAVQWLAPGAASPDLRRVAAGPRAGAGWLGLRPRVARQVLDREAAPLAPPWAWLAGAAVLLLFSWVREGRSGGLTMRRGRRA
jgi:hypothetical protein